MSNASSSSAPVLYASDYGYDHGFVWYRGHFTATPAILAVGKDNVLAILVENTGNPEGPSGEKAGLRSASLAGSSAPVSWRLMGDPGGSTLQDAARGVMNPSGLFGADNGWDLPGYPDASWQDVTLPDSWSARGVPAGIGWYRTTFSLNLPSRGYVPIDVQIGGPGPGAGTADYRAFIYVNGWLIGRYVNNVGPQHQFYVPAGILNDHGGNTLADAGGGAVGDAGDIVVHGDRHAAEPDPGAAALGVAVPRGARGGVDGVAVRAGGRRHGRAREVGVGDVHRDHAVVGAVGRGGQPGGVGRVRRFFDPAGADGDGERAVGVTGGDVQQHRYHRQLRHLADLGIHRL